jgi:hypothetical protein
MDQVSFLEFADHGVSGHIVPFFAAHRLVKIGVEGLLECLDGFDIEFLEHLEDLFQCEIDPLGDPLDGVVVVMQGMLSARSRLSTTGSSSRSNASLAYRRMSSISREVRFL